MRFAILLCVFSFSIASLHAQPAVAEVQKLLASDAQTGDRFGYSVSISADHAIIGAHWEDTGGSNAGAAYVYERDGAGVWQEVQKLVASDAQPDDEFGFSVSISGDRAVVGSYEEDAGGSDAGAAYVFERDGAGVWQEVEKLVASDAQADDQYGWSVSISGDHVVVGAQAEDSVGFNAGAAYVYERNGAGVWQEVQKLVAGDAQGSDLFGVSVSISGERLVVGARLEDDGGSAAGAAYVYERDGAGVWQEVQKLVASDAQAFDEFGRSVSISADRLVVGAWFEDSGASSAGAAYVFERNGAGVWQEAQKLVASDAQVNDNFGISASISGDWLIVGAYTEDAGGGNAGAAYLYERDGAGVWQELQKLVASDAQSNDWFGFSVSISGDRAVVGALNEDVGGGNAGAAYVFESTSQTTVQSFTACDSVWFGGTWYTANDTLTDSLTTTVGGFDSIVITEITVHPSFSVQQPVVSGCDSALVGSAWYFGDTTLTDSFTTVFGCDSLRITEVRIDGSSLVNQSITADDSARVNGVWYTSSQIITDSLLTVAGCDSIVVTDLTIETTTGISDRILAELRCFSTGDAIVIDLRNADLDGRADVVVTDPLGRVVASRRGIGREEVRLQHISSAGIYMVTVVQEGRRFTKRVAIAR